MPLRHDHLNWYYQPQPVDHPPRRVRPARAGRRAVLRAAVVLLTLVALLGGAQRSMASTVPALPTWADEFDAATLDPTRWSHRATGPRHDGILTPDAVSVADGMLTIKTYTESGEHYSGMISTHRHGSNGFEQAYGYFEARVRFNDAPGQWSAFWLQSPTIGVPLGDPASAGVEMDVVEHRVRCTDVTSSPACAAGADISDRAHRALIWNGYGDARRGQATLSDPLAGLSNGTWHTWALRWTPTDVTFYYDGTVTGSTRGPISQRSQYMILSSEVGRLFAGEIPAGGYGSREQSTTNMQVDYVRVWANSPHDAPGAPAPAPSPSPSPEPTPSHASLRASTTQKLGAVVAMTISCPDEDCRATAAVTVRVPRVGRASARTYRPRATTTAIAGGTRRTVRVSLSRESRGAIARALKSGRRITATLTARVADRDGNVVPLTRRVRLRR